MFVQIATRIELGILSGAANSIGQCQGSRLSMHSIATTGQILCLVLRPRACILGHTKANKRQMGATNIIIESCQSRKIVRKLCGQCGGHRAWLRDSLKVVRREVLGGQTSESLAGLLKHPPSQPTILCRLAMDRANNDCRQTWLEGLAAAGRGCCTVGRTEACPPVQAG